MNCRNCGAPVTSYICEYCGTFYGNAKQQTLYMYRGKIVEEDKNDKVLCDPMTLVIPSYKNQWFASHPRTIVW